MRILILGLLVVWLEDVHGYAQAPGMYPESEMQTGNDFEVPRNPYQSAWTGYEYYYEKNPTTPPPESGSGKMPAFQSIETVETDKEGPEDPEDFSQNFRASGSESGPKPTTTTTTTSSPPTESPPPLPKIEVAPSSTTGIPSLITSTPPPSTTVSISTVPRRIEPISPDTGTDFTAAGELYGDFGDEKDQKSPSPSPAPHKEKPKDSEDEYGGPSGYEYHPKSSKVSGAAPGAQPEIETFASPNHAGYEIEEGPKPLKKPGNYPNSSGKDKKVPGGSDPSDAYGTQPKTSKPSEGDIKGPGPSKPSETYGTPSATSKPSGKHQDGPDPYDPSETYGTHMKGSGGSKAQGAQHPPSKPSGKDSDGPRASDPSEAYGTQPKTSGSSLNDQDGPGGSESYGTQSRVSKPSGSDGTVPDPTDPSETYGSQSPTSNPPGNNANSPEAAPQPQSYSTGSAEVAEPVKPKPDGPKNLLTSIFETKPQNIISKSSKDFKDSKDPSDPEDDLGGPSGYDFKQSGPKVAPRATGAAPGDQPESETNTLPKVPANPSGSDTPEGLGEENFPIIHGNKAPELPDGEDYTELITEKHESWSEIPIAVGYGKNSGRDEEDDYAEPYPTGHTGHTGTVTSTKKSSPSSRGPSTSNNAITPRDRYDHFGTVPFPPPSTTSARVNPNSNHPPPPSHSQIEEELTGYMDVNGVVLGNDRSLAHNTITGMTDVRAQISEIDRIAESFENSAREPVEYENKITSESSKGIVAETRKDIMKHLGRKSRKCCSCCDEKQPVSRHIETKVEPSQTQQLVEPSRPLDVEKDPVQNFVPLENSNTIGGSAYIQPPQSPPQTHYVQPFQQYQPQYPQSYPYQQSSGCACQPRPQNCCAPPAPCCLPTIPCCPPIPCCPQPKLCCQPQPTCAPQTCCSINFRLPTIPICGRACPSCPCRRRVHKARRLKRHALSTNCNTCSAAGEPWRSVLHREKRSACAGGLSTHQSSCTTCGASHLRSTRVKRMGCLPCLGRKKRDTTENSHIRVKRMGCLPCLNGGRKKRSAGGCSQCNSLGHLFNRYKRSLFGCSPCAQQPACSCQGRKKRSVTMKIIKRAPLRKEQCDATCCDYSRCLDKARQKKETLVPFM